MKVTAIAATLFASVAFAQLDKVPQCAVSCFLTALQSDGCSGLTDFKCHCSKTELIPSVQPCVQKACSADDQAKTITGVQGVCEAAGVPIVIPNPGGASSAPASSAPASSAPASSAPASSAPASSAPASSSAAGQPTPYPSSTLTSAKPTGTGALPTGTNSTGTPPPFTGAAPQVTQVGAVLAGLAVAAFAL